SGESLIRQILYGDRFYKQEFGTYTPIAWLPDVFGYSPNMPQILKKAGIRYFLTCKVYWQKENVFPYRLFWWEGIDGSRVLAHTPWTGQMYNNNPTPQLYLFTWKNFTEKENYDGVLIPYGFGDGGGGPTPEQVERCILMSKIPILPKSEFSTVSTYFKDAEKKAKDLPVWFGEIYVESHRGTLTSQAWLKKANRYTENLYREAEIFSSLSRIMGEEIDIEKLTEGWKLILLNQFHDVLSGTSTPEVYLDSRRDHKKINQWGEEILEKALSVIVNRHVLSDAKKGICVFNPSSWVRSEIVEIDCSTNSIFKGLKTIEGNPVPVQILRSEGGKRKLIFEVEEVSPFGFQYYETTDKEFEFSQNEMKVRPQLLENEFIRIELRVDGLIERIISKTSGRQFIEDGKVANLIQLFIDGPLDDEAWNIDPAFEEIVSDITGAIEISVMESGPLRGRIRVKRRFGKSKITQDIIIYRKKSVVDFRTYVDWQETQKMLKVSFPTNLKAQYATYEVAYGVYQRPTYRNNPWERQLFEVSMHRFVDISEGNRGVALLNDCKYGGDVSGGRIRLTLLRAPTHPHPKLDRGEHLFTYSLYVHEGDWRTGQVVHRAAELNNPLLVRRVGREKGKTPAVAQAGFILVEPENIIVEVMKRCEDEDATLLRAYECHGNLTRATFEFPFQVKEIVESDLLEQPKRKIASGKRRFEIEFGPFEIKTFILYI
ncbi:MAG TPA: alpha-mannosidase, partial [Candidatus Omnitrophica bacterium]|nr:alpha-mannosidase [Candidatus Omnitrophota bacterium]